MPVIPYPSQLDVEEKLLDHSQWTSWVLQVKLQLRLFGLWDCVQNIEATISPTFHYHDRLARSLILTACHEKVSEVAVRYNTAAGVWQHLESTFHPNNACALYNSLLAIRIERFATPEKFVEAFVNNAHLLARVGSLISDHVLIGQFLSAVEHQYGVWADIERSWWNECQTRKLPDVIASFWCEVEVGRDAMAGYMPHGPPPVYLQYP